MQVVSLFMWFTMFVTVEVDYLYRLRANNVVWSKDSRCQKSSGGMDQTEELPTKFNKYKRIREKEKAEAAARIAEGTAQSVSEPW